MRLHSALLGILSTLLMISSLQCQRSPGRQGTMTPRCPMCGGPWQSPSGWNGTIPEKLPKPKNQEWVRRFQEILAIEKQSLAQYTSDEKKFRTPRPYMMVIPQEQDHTYWIGQLFRAYGIAPGTKALPVIQSKTLDAAYRTAIGIEAKSVPRYEWLITNAEDQTTKQALDTILFQTRMHYMMFTHALRMGGMGMGRG